MSKSLTFDRSRLCATLWQLAQVFWVGGLFMMQVLVAPALGLTGLAPLLLQDLIAQANVLLVGVAGFGIAVQCLALACAGGVRALREGARGPLLLISLLACLIYLALVLSGAQVGRVQVLSYAVLGVCGLLLVLQPVPGAGRQA
ncbi:hypothetical protein [Pseudomonas sp. NPDC007930]|uniref:hypothetical protein n=1 Tax=Pseudomonas sp. NPDC007930 TaxID=3364417 RepID=UPI0036E9EE7C